MLEQRLRKRLDLPLLLVTYVIAALGVMFIYSATHGESAAFHRKQMLWIAFGSVGLATCLLVDYHRIERISKYLYWLDLALLALVLRAAHSVNGAARWIRIGGFPFQPSEFAKLAIIVTLAVYLVRRAERIGEWKTLLGSFLFVAVPTALIFKQPDLGTALVVLAIWLGMVFIAGASWRQLAALLVTGCLLFTGLWLSGKVIKSYQKNRLISFVNPEADPHETGYHVLQARIAIGSGGMWGKGFLRGTQVHGGYIPERQTDFIFTDVGEEWGFVGTAAVTGLYALLLMRGIAIVATTREDPLGRLIAAGVVTMLAFHVIVNIGMNIGLMPVAGVPLPLISAGGSNVIVTLASIGLLESIAVYRHQLLF